MVKRIAASHSEAKTQGSLNADIARKRRRAGGGYVDGGVWLQRIVVGHETVRTRVHAGLRSSMRVKAKPVVMTGEDGCAWRDAGRNAECGAGRGDLNGDADGSEAIQTADVESAYG